MQPEPSRILVVDDEPNIRRLLCGVLEDEGFETESVSDAESAAASVRDGNFDLVLLDVCLPGDSGLVWLRELRGRLPVIMMSGHGTIDTALQAVRLGAVDFLEKPIPVERLLLSVTNAMERARLVAENERLRRTNGGELLGDSAPMQALRDSIARFAPTAATVLIRGENGTGKELVARALHRQSSRSTGPLVQVNCAAIPTELLESELFGHEKGAFSGAEQMRRGRFELADGGTLLLDEIGEMVPALQAKLLRVLEDGQLTRVGAECARRVDVRLLAATNVDLEEAVAAGRFREDLFHRLCVLPLRVPALREHAEDVPLYARTFLKGFCQELGREELGLAEDAVELLLRRSWPGNVRELRNLMQRTAILASGSTVGREELAGLLDEAVAGGESEGHGTLAGELGALERKLIRAAVEEAGGNLAEAARRLGVDRANLHRRMRRLDIQRP